MSASRATTTLREPLLDPTSEAAAELRHRVLPPASLEGSTVGLVSISKERSDEYLQYLGARLEARGIQVRHLRKPTHTRPAPEVVVQEVVNSCDVVVEGLAD